MNLSNFSIGHRLKAGFLVVLGFSVLLAFVAWLQLRKVGDIVNEINDSWMVSVVDLNAIMGVISDARRAELHFVLAKTDAERESEERARTDAWKRMADPTRRYEATGISGPEEQKIYDKFLEALKQYQATWPRLRETARGADDAQARTAAANESRAQFEKAKAQLLTDIQFNVDGAARMKVKSRDALGESNGYIVSTLLAILLLGSGFALWLGRSITAPLQRAMAWARTIASGDLSTTEAAHSRDETGQLLAALAGMQTTLQRMIGEMRASAEAVATASQQIAVGNNDLSARTEQQASNLQQTAASIEQLSATVSSSDSSARQARQLADSAVQIASAGGLAVGRVSGRMGEISGSSKKIADIIGVIDGIAFQTNILALNAAVEAARAGEQGRGFAVVASEVRTLAQRSAQAAKEIKSLIQESVEHVSAGDALVGEATATMAQIVDAVKQVGQRIAEISSAASEQTAGIQQVHGAVNQLDQATQQNAALVEESAAASESLKEQAQRLAASVSQFRLRTA